MTITRKRSLNLAERKAHELARGLFESDRRISVFMLDFLRRVYHLLRGQTKLASARAED